MNRKPLLQELLLITSAQADANRVRTAAGAARRGTVRVPMAGSQWLMMLCVPEEPLGFALFGQWLMTPVDN